jgi:hypothetical protein
MHSSSPSRRNTLFDFRVVPDTGVVLLSALDRSVLTTIETLARDQRLNLMCILEKPADLVQGFYFAKPMSIADFEIWLSQREPTPHLSAGSPL